MKKQEPTKEEEKKLNYSSVTHQRVLSLNIVVKFE